MTAVAVPSESAHVALVFKIASKLARDYTARGGIHLHRDELVGYGYAGLRRAVRDFDGRGDFERYASSLIAFEIRGGLRDWFQTRRIRRAGVRVTLDARALDVVDHRNARALDVVDDVEDLRSALRRLPYRHRVILSRYLTDSTLKEVGAELGISESRACQLEHAALATLRARLGAA